MDKFDKKPFNKRMKYYLTWHKPFSHKRYAYCPNCNNLLKDNSEGFFRCSKCEKRFIILECTDNEDIKEAKKKK